MRHRRLFRKRLALWVAGLSLLAGAPAGLAAISVGGPLPVRILYDNSGSMYPGYAPPGRPGTPKSVSGARFFHEYPEIQQWLADFVAHQTILDGETVSMATFTSFGEFHPNDIKEVHPEVPIAQFDIARAVRSFPKETGRTTYLTESLDRYSRGFEGLVWLITDNIVETRAGESNAEVRRFFEALRDEPRYRSVHLFKYPFRDERSGQSAALAVYGILVSDSEVGRPVLAYYDRKFRSTFRFANRRQGDPPAQLFPGREHLKLKDLNVDALELQAEPNLQVVLDDPAKELFEEGQKVQLELQGKIQSYLTQHSVTGGRYQLQFVNAFEPEDWAVEQLGARKLAPSLFPGVDGQIQEPIPPNQTRDVTAVLPSSQPISLKGGGLGAWLRLAVHGAAVKYTGRVRMSFDDVQVRLEREQMAGIFGIDQASDIFDIQEDMRNIEVAPSEAAVSFAIKTGSSRTAVFLLLLAFLAVLFGLPAMVLARQRWYRIRITGTPERLVSLRRLGSHQVVYEGQPLGRLSRGVAGDHDFAPNAHSAAFAITPAQQTDTYDVRFRDGRGVQLSIEPQGGGKKPGRKEKVRTDPGPAPSASVAPGPAAARSLPKIDRP